MALTIQQLNIVHDHYLQLPALFLRKAKYDDLLAIVAILVAGIAYISNGLFWNLPDPNRHKLFERPQQLNGSSSASPSSRDLSEKLKEAQCNIAVLWASQSGTAERLAGRLANELTRYFGAKALLLDISDIEPASLSKLSGCQLAFFLASTFGEGDPSDNFHDCWTWLQSGEKVTLSNLRFMAFGLGNSKYKHYNHVVDVLTQKLQERGAQMLLPTGRADDANGETEEHFLGWKETVFELLQTSLQYEKRDSKFEPSVHVVEDASLQPSDVYNGMPKAEKFTTKKSKIAALPLVDSRELFANTEQRNCLHLEFDLSKHPEHKYKTGDYLAIWPVNPVDEVNRLLRLLGLDDKRAVPLHVQTLNEVPVKVPSPTTPEALLQSYLAICAPVSRDVVATLATLAPTESAKAFLERLCDNRNAYADYISSHYANFGTLLEAASSGDGAWSQLPLSIVVEMLPTTQPRYYSISSSSIVQPRQLSITAVVSDLPLSNPEVCVPGVTTNYLLSAKDGIHPKGMQYAKLFPTGTVCGQICKSTFKLPITASAPIIMVGAGTGVAPFRAFVQERARLKSMGRDIGRTKLYFGCRNPSQDFIYSDEFAALGKTLDDSFSMSTAFSRPEDGSKKYVQDAIVEEADEVCNLLLEQNAYFYICGSAAMARDVTDAVSKLIMEKKQWNESELKEFTNAKKRQRRWMQDVWG